jgi:capsid protein
MFEFQARNVDKGLNRDVELLMDRWSRPSQCDVAGRHRLSKFIRLAEIRKILDGDVGVMRLSAGQLQGIEGDMIRNAAGLEGRWISGVKVNDAGRHLAYALHRRTDRGRLEFDRTVSSANLFLHGAYDRFSQIRGVSPINAALNQFRDVYENFDYALAKAKVTQLFALAFYRKATDSAGLLSEEPTINEDGNEVAASESDEPKYRVDFGRGPAVLDLEPGDDAKVLESSQPSSQFQDFTKLVTQVALKSIDVPYSLFDESHTNFFGSRGALMHYERSCEEKRADLQDLLRWITVWRLSLWILDDELVLPSGMELADLQWEWVPRGTPWWDPAKEITGDEKAIKGGLDNPYRITRDHGKGDVEDNIDQTAQAILYAREKGVILSYDTIGQELAKLKAAELLKPKAKEETEEDDAAA